MSDPMFSSYEGPRERTFTLRMLMIGATVAIPVLVLVGWGLNLERSGPYDNMVDRLRPEMSKSDMWRELGVPQQAFVRIDGRGERDWYVYKQLGTDYELRVWHENYYGLGDESAGLGGWCVIRPGEADDKIDEWWKSGMHFGCHSLK